MELVARVLCMCLELLVPLGAVGILDGVFLMIQWVGAVYIVFTVCGVVDVRGLIRSCHNIVLLLDPCDL